MSYLPNWGIGTFIPLDSLIHRLDPRVKIVSVVILIIFLFTANSLPELIPYLALSLLLFYLSKISFKALIKSLKPILFLLIFALIFQVFFTPGEVLLKISFLSITKEGLNLALVIGLRLILLVLLTNLLTFTTSPVSITDGIEDLLKILKFFRIPSHEIAMTMSISLRFIPTLFEEAERIMKAQMARGAEFGTGKFFERIKGYVPLVIPLFIGVFRKAEELAIAMESRCYRGGEGRTRIKKLHLAARDYVAIIFIFIFLFLNITIKWL
ncbi:MAG: cobalt ECF transporter T component CbiQ [Synergistetes bacterium]|nr:cobalt ECF transporter T component CbiQ [Synergistota bacterium]